MLKCMVLLLLIVQLVEFKVTAVDNEASLVAESFKSNGLVPNVIPVAPSDLAVVKYPTGAEVQLGKQLKPSLVKDAPKVTWNAADGEFYAIAMIDVDVPSRNKSDSLPWNHWLVTNIPNGNQSDGRVLAEYIGAGPMVNTGPHRYVLLVYRQPSNLTFDEPLLNNTSVYKRASFNITAFAGKYNLSNPLAGNYFEAIYDDYVPSLYKQLGIPVPEDAVKSGSVAAKYTSPFFFVIILLYYQSC